MPGMIFQTSLRSISLDRCLVMAILNVTPDSFSDGGEFINADKALDRVEQLIKDGADIIDIGGESTRPGSGRVDEQEEIRRTIPIISAIKKRFDIPLSIDTSKAAVAAAAINAGAEIINDISGLRFDDDMAKVAAENNAGLVIMHSRGEFSEMHSQPPVADIFKEVVSGLKDSIDIALLAGISKEQIVLDPGFGFGKTFEQNIELLAGLEKLICEFKDHSMLIGVSRKSFIGKLLADAAIEERLAGSISAAVVAAMKGAKIIRVHDVKETADALKIVNAVQGVS